MNVLSRTFVGITARRADHALHPLLAREEQTLLLLVVRAVCVVSAQTDAPSFPVPRRLGTDAER